MAAEAGEEVLNTEGTHSYKIIGHLGKILARNTGAKKEEIKELEKDLSLLTPPEADALVEAGTLELLLRYLTVDPHFDVVTRCLVSLSSYDSSRAALYDMNENGMQWLGEFMITQAKGAKAEKQIEKATMLIKILVLYSIDGPGTHLGWMTDICELLVSALQRSQTKGGMQESYSYLSVILPGMWVSMGSSLAPVISAAIINAGGMPMLFKVAKEVQRSDIKGLPKIVAEKALNLLCACNAEQPGMSVAQVPAKDIASFCLDTVTKSDWVQSQELSILLLARMVYQHHVLPESYMSNKPVGAMLHHAMKTKSPALRMTAFCLSLICPESVFESVCIEANEVIMDLAEGSFQSIKRLSSPAAAGMTILSFGHPLNKFAQDLLRSSKLLTRMAETLPAQLPAQLVELLPPDLKQYVTSIKAANGLKGGLVVTKSKEEGYEEGQQEEVAVDQAPGGSGSGKAGKRGRTGQGSDTDSHGAAGADGKRAKVSGGQLATHQHHLSMMAQVSKQPIVLAPKSQAAPGPGSSKAAGVATQPASKQTPVQQPQSAAPRASGGGATSGGGAGSGFTSNDFSQLNGMAFDLVMKGDTLDEKARQVLDHLMQGIKMLPALLDLKYKLPEAASISCDNTLRQWSNRVRQMLGSLPDAKGPGLDMLHTFSNMMLEEITCCLKETQYQAGVKE